METLPGIAMDIQQPITSQILAILIQNIHAEDRQEFREDAEKASDRDAFIKGMGKYRTVPE